MHPKVGDLAPSFETSDQKGIKINFPADFGGRNVALLFLRYIGCPLCLMKMQEIKDRYAQFKDKNMEVLVVVQSSPRRVSEFAEKQGLPFRLIADREKELYQLYDVQGAGLLGFMAPNVLKETVKATLKGHMHGAFEGDEFQAPADFVIGPEGKVRFAYYAKDIADFSPLQNILNAVE